MVFLALRENRVLKTTFPAISHFVDEGFREKAELPEQITDCFFFYQHKTIVVIIVI